MIDVMLETEGLELTNPELYNGEYIYVDINGRKYVYTHNGRNDLNMYMIYSKFKKMIDFSHGKALAFLKKNCDGKPVGNKINITNRAALDSL